MYHAPIVDCEGPRRGWRVVGMGGQPYLDPNSMSRAEATAQKKKLANGSGENGSAEAMAEKKKLANGSCGCDGMAEAMAAKKKLANGSAKNGV